MAVAFKDLCLDANDVAAVGRFWAGALGGRFELRPDGVGAVRPDGAPFPLHVLWINPVPEPKVVKNRVHLDVHGRADDLVALGATVLGVHDGWQVLADPEGNELCVFPRPPAAGSARVDVPAEVFAICIDSAAPVELAAWWHARLGGTVGPGPDGRPRWLRDGAGCEDLVVKFVAVDDARVAKNRCHWDVTGDVDELVAAGATVLADPGTGWRVLADPDGNEFCAFP